MEMGRLGGSRAGKDRHYILVVSCLRFRLSFVFFELFVHRSCSSQICIIAQSHYFFCRKYFDHSSRLVDACMSCAVVECGWSCLLFVHQSEFNDPNRIAHQKDIPESHRRSQRSFLLGRWC